MESEAGRLWRQKAAQLRATAALIANPLTRDHLLREAADYEMRARQEDERAEAGKRPIK
jgi:hypothetical protein